MLMIPTPTKISLLNIAVLNTLMVLLLYNAAIVVFEYPRIKQL